MPIYNYRCSTCEEQFRVSHSMTEVQEICEICESIGTLTRVPSFFSNLKLEKKQKTGAYVKEFIENSAAALKDQKQLLKEKSNNG